MHFYHCSALSCVRNKMFSLPLQLLAPHVRVWDSVSLNTLHVLGTGFFDRALVCLAFSKSVRKCVAGTSCIHRRTKKSWNRCASFLLGGSVAGNKKKKNAFFKSNKNIHEIKSGWRLTNTKKTFKNPTTSYNVETNIFQ